MAEQEVSDQALALLSVAIGMIMEDHAEAAVSALPGGPDDVREHFKRLRQAGSDIVVLADAAEVMLRL